MNTLWKLAFFFSFCSYGFGVMDVQAKKLEANAQKRRNAAQLRKVDHGTNRAKAPGPKLSPQGAGKRPQPQEQRIAAAMAGWDASDQPSQRRATVLSESKARLLYTGGMAS